MEKERQSHLRFEEDRVIRRPAYPLVFSLIFFLLSLPLFFYDSPTTVASGMDTADLIAACFYLLTGLSFWRVMTGIAFLFVVGHLFVYRRFKLVIREKGLSVTPVFGTTHEVPFSSIRYVTHDRRFSGKGFSIRLTYDTQSIRFPYTLDRHGHIKQTSISYLLKKLAALKVPIHDA